MSDTPAPPAGMKKKEKDAKKIDDGYAKKAAEARGGGEMSERLTAVGAIAKAISGEVQKEGKIKLDLGIDGQFKFVNE